MKNIIFGNGVNIQYGGLDYLNKNIIKRALKMIRQNKIPKEIYPLETGDYLVALHNIIKEVLKGNYDKFVFTETEKKELATFKSNYKKCLNKSKISDIGFEDYFLLHNLACRNLDIKNPEKFNFQEVLRLLFLDSIYNDGKINNICEKFPKSFVKWVKEFDNIFKTNYDKNIEIATGMKVNYIHGAFHIRKDIYKEDSFRNKISDRPIKDAIIIDGYDHLYSTALTSYSGGIKEFAANMHSNANSGIEKFAKGYLEDDKIRKDIDQWKDDESIVIRNLYESIMIKIDNPDIKFNDEYPLDNLSKMSGILYICGLSPNNDIHIMDMIINNKDITKIVYYYYGNTEKKDVISLFPRKNIELKDVKDLWESFK